MKTSVQNKEMHTKRNKKTYRVAHLRAKDLRVGLLQQLLLKGLLRVQPEAFPRPGPTRSTTPLLGARPRDGADQQRLHADAGVVHLERWGRGRCGEAVVEWGGGKERGRRKRGRKERRFPR